jgi:hypothetical protein
MAHLLSKARVVGSWAAPFALSILIALPASSQVTVLEVGPTATYTTIQDAIDAVVNGADTEIRVEQNLTYTENLEVPATFDSGSLSILGGWDATFSTRDPDPEHTVIDGDASGRALNILIEGGRLLVDGFTFTNGKGDGAGVRVETIGSPRTTTRPLRQPMEADSTPTFTAPKNSRSSTALSTATLRPPRVRPDTPGGEDSSSRLRKSRPT